MEQFPLCAPPNNTPYPTGSPSPNLTHLFTFDFYTTHSPCFFNVHAFLIFFFQSLSLLLTKINLCTFKSEKRKKKKKKMQWCLTIVGSLPHVPTHFVLKLGIRKFKENTLSSSTAKSTPLAKLYFKKKTNKKSCKVTLNLAASTSTHVLLVLTAGVLIGSVFWNGTFASVEIR